MNRFYITKGTLIILVVAIICSTGFAQEPYRFGTTTANFLEIGFGTAGSAMGDAYVSTANDLSSIYWNPAGLAYMKQSEAQFLYQPWLVDINSAFVGVGLVLENLGTFAFGVYQVGYGDMKVTNLQMQAGTGEFFSANDYSFNLSFGRKLAEWFAFGASLKYISSQIWHTNAMAIAADLGVVVNTHFFSPNGDRVNGLKIGMSISNYGTKMKYDGIDLLNPIDILPGEAGNYRDVAGQFKLESWELPLIFRIGVSVNPIIVGAHELTLAMDAIHPNNNSESVNIGAQYKLRIPNAGDFYLRGGYKAMFLENSEFGLALGGGMTMRLMNNIGLKVEYAYRGVGILGNSHCYTFGILF